MHSSTMDASAQQALNFVLAEREKCLSDREWEHRIAGYGYGVRNWGPRRVLTSLTRNEAICDLG